MKPFRLILSVCIFLIIQGCSGKSNVHLIYVNGDVSINNSIASTGIIEGKELSINTGKNSSVIALVNTRLVLALSEETSLRINNGRFYLDTGRAIASIADDVTIESKELKLEAEESLLELISRNNVSVLNIFSGSAVTEGIVSGNTRGEIILNENFSIESVNGRLSPAVSIGTDSAGKNIPLRDLVVTDNPDMVNISSECISIINSRYGLDLDQRYSLNRLSSVYGSLSEIMTKNGKHLIGAVRVSGSKMTVFTTEGSTVIPVTEVKIMKQYSGK